MQKKMSKNIKQWYNFLNSNFEKYLEKYNSGINIS